MRRPSLRIRDRVSRANPARHNMRVHLASQAMALRRRSLATARLLTGNNRMGHRAVPLRDTRRRVPVIHPRAATSHQADLAPRLPDSVHRPDIRRWFQVPAPTRLMASIR